MTGKNDDEKILEKTLINIMKMETFRNLSEIFRRKQI